MIREFKILPKRRVINDNPQNRRQYRCLDLYFPIRVRFVVLRSNSEPWTEEFRVTSG